MSDLVTGSTIESLSHRLMGALMGAAVGDALGVPHEFVQREVFYSQPVTGMDAYGTHNQPEGTWSDDTSMTLATADIISAHLQANAELPDSDFLKALILAFLRWMQQGEYSPHGRLFDIGNTTYGVLMDYAITPHFKSAALVLEGAEFRDSQGNGSLMRLLPVALWNMLLPLPQSFMDQISCITHAHPAVLSACQHYIETLSFMFQHGFDPIIGIEKATKAARRRKALYVPDLQAISQRPEYQVRSGGYVIETLEAVYWCLYQKGTYAEMVLRAVNLGGDTDTIASIVGGMAGLHQGIVAIPKPWLDALQNKALLDTVYSAYIQHLTRRYLER